MSHLGDVLELLFAAPDPTVAVHAVIQERYDAGASRRAGDALTAQLKHETRGTLPVAARAMMVPALAAAVAYAGAAEVAGRVRRKARVEPRAAESRLELWLGPTGRVRMERTYTGPGGTATIAATATIEGVRSGPASRGGMPAWPRPGDPAGRWPEPGAVDVERHFAHQLLRRIVAALDLREAGAGEVAGRPVVVAHATRRGGDGPWPHWLPYGPGGYELRFDREYGDLLAYAATFEGRTFESAAVTSIAYGGRD